MPPPSICLLGLDNLPALSPAHAHLGVGGEPIQQTLIARALARRGFRVSMVVCDLGQEDAIVIDGITVYKAHQPDAGLPLLRFAHPRWTSVMAALRRADADAYYTSCAGIGTAQLALTARRRGAGTVFRIASDADCDPDRLLIPYWYGKRIYEWGLPRLSRVLAQSAAQREAIRAHYRVDSQVAGMLVDHGRSDRPFEARRRHGLWVGNIRQLKRPDLMLELARRLPALQFEMVGGTQPRSEALYAEVLGAAASMQNLEFTGPVPYASVGAIFEGSRVFVNTSDTEGFPNTYLQAWARGVPVVAFFDPDAVIAREGLGHAATSFDDLQRAVARLSMDPMAWQAASARCVAFMEREFAEERVLRPYLDAFEQCAATREARQ